MNEILKGFSYISINLRELFYVLTYIFISYLKTHETVAAVSKLKRLRKNCDTFFLHTSS